MFKKPLFWIIILIILVILWFVFANQKKFHDTEQNLSVQINSRLTTKSNLNAQQSSAAKRTLEAEREVLLPPRNPSSYNFNHENNLTESDWATEIID